MEELQVLTVAVRSSDGCVFHQGENSERRLRQLAYGPTDVKWRHLVRQLLHNKRACKVRLIVGYNEGQEGGITWKYEEMSFRPIKQLPPTVVVNYDAPNIPPPPKALR